MIIDRVNFNDGEVRKLTEDEFLEAHMPYLWTDRDEDTRRKMLAEAYRRVCGRSDKVRKKK